MSKFNDQGLLLLSLAREMQRASTLLERDYWRNSLKELVRDKLVHEDQAALGDMFEFMYAKDRQTHAAFIEVLETAAETCEGELNGRECVFQLISLPVTVWSHYGIPYGPISAGKISELSRMLGETILAKGVRFALAPGLYSIEHIPFSHSDILKIVTGMSGMLTQNAPAELLFDREVEKYYGDSRYILAVVAVEPGRPLFRWQQADATTFAQEKDKCLEMWKKQSLPVFSELLPGCSIEVKLPGGYFASTRRVERELRPLTVKSAGVFLEQKLKTPIDQFGVVIGAFCNETDATEVEQYRISFYRRDDKKIVYGVSWSLFENEYFDSVVQITENEKSSSSQFYEEHPELMELLDVLDSLGLCYEDTPIERFQNEYCEDCGAPLFVDTNGELVHPELPEDVETDPVLQ